MKSLITLMLILFVTACGTPIKIEGEGSVLSRTGNSDCTYEDYQAGLDKCKYNWLRSAEEREQVIIGQLVPDAYAETYYAIPKPGWALKSMKVEHISQVVTVLSWSYKCKVGNRNDCPLFVNSDGVESYLKNNVNPVLTTKFIPRTDELTINSVFPAKVFTSDKNQRIVIKGQGFQGTDLVSLVDLVDPNMEYPKVPVWLDEAAGIMVIQAKFNNPEGSRWILKVTRQDNSETFSIPFDVVNTLNAGAFLRSPIDDSSCTSRPCSPYEAEISAVMDHSGTPLDLEHGGSWYGQDGKVIAYTGEIAATAGAGTDASFAPAYKNATGSNFVINGSYVGTKIYYSGTDTCIPNSVTKTCIREPSYLNYDGHTGYDYAYASGATMRAPEEGYLFRARTDSINSKSVNPAWNKFHAFYILHKNGMTSWFLHAQNLHANISSKLGSDLDQPVWVSKGQILAEPSNYCLGCTLGKHLHFEVRRGEHEIVDPYYMSYGIDPLWAEVPPLPPCADPNAATCPGSTAFCAITANKTHVSCPGSILYCVAHPSDPACPVPPPPPSCGTSGQGLVIETLNWASQSRQKTIVTGKVGAASKFTTTSSTTYRGYFSGLATATSANLSRRMWFSECPGAAPIVRNYTIRGVLKNACDVAGFEPMLSWSQENTPTNLTTCKLTRSKTYYLNYSQVAFGTGAGPTTTSNLIRVASTAGTP